MSTSPEPDVFKALADERRRSLLDYLAGHDGASLGELELVLPELTRFGVMRHLRLLEEAQLVTTMRHGRHKLHYLNAVPIQLVADRWISQYARPLARHLLDLRNQLEENDMTEKPHHIHQILIRTTPEALWEALTSPQLSRDYYYGTAVESEFKPGSSVVYRGDDGVVYIDGKILEADPPSRLAMTCSFHFNDVDDPPSTVSWDISNEGGGVCKVVVRHEFDEMNASYEIAATGYTSILSGLKTLLETGQPLLQPA